MSSERQHYSAILAIFRKTLAEHPKASAEFLAQAAYADIDRDGELNALTSWSVMEGLKLLARKAFPHLPAHTPEDTQGEQATDEQTLRQQAQDLKRHADALETETEFLEAMRKMRGGSSLR